MKKMLFFSFLALVSVFTFSCKKDGNSTHTVKYTIQGSSKSNVTYTDQNGNVQSQNNEDANWTISFPSSHHGLLLKLTVVSSDGSPVGGKIFIDGNQSAQSNGTVSNIAISTVLP
jgi:hypothetical protein